MKEKICPITVAQAAPAIPQSQTKIKMGSRMVLIIAPTTIKVIQIAVEDTGISKGFLHVRSAFLALNHNKEMCIWQ